MIATAAAAALVGVAAARHRRVVRYRDARVVVVDVAVYPVKGLGRAGGGGTMGPSDEALAKARSGVRVEPRGLQHDRRFMVVDEGGNFITQRQYPQMAVVRTNVVGGAEDAAGGPLRLVLSTASGDKVEVADWAQGNVVTVRVWDSMVEGAIDQGDEVAAWLQKVLRVPGVRLVYQPPDGAHRPTRRNPEHEVSFADGYPVLVASVASLADLNRRIPNGEVIPMARFRPNVVVDGLFPWMEDTVGLTFSWTDANGRRGKFFINKPCDRCKVTTVVPEDGVFSTTGEPLATLGTFRRLNNNAEVYFGANMLVVGDPDAVLRVGDVLRVGWP